MKLEKLTPLSQIEKNKMSCLGQALYQHSVNVDCPAKSWMMLPAPERADWEIRELKVAEAAIRKYSGNIKMVDFTLVTPNMANISRALDAGLKHLVKDTHSAKTNIRLESAPDSALRIAQGDAVTNGLVGYASRGGGDITIKVNNLKKKISTTSSVKEVSISELEIKGKTPEQLLKTLELLLK